MKTIPDLLDRTAAEYPNKIAFVDASSSITYGVLNHKVRIVASTIAKRGYLRSPVVVYLNRHIACVTAMLAVACSGNFYAVIDPQMPPERVRTILETLHPVCVVTERALAASAPGTGDCDILVLEDIAEQKEDENLLSTVRAQMTDADLLYCLFTSGSTGVPKGTAVSHRNVISYSRWVIETFDISPETVFGSQAPFYFSMSVTDLFGTLRSGATMVIIPKEFFSFPVKLISFMNTNGVNTIYWVPSALSIIANLNVFKYMKLEKIKKVLFAGEVMTVKQLNYWREWYPDILYANLFGPTESTDICTYYIVDREFTNGQSLPIGRHCANCQVIVLDEHGKECAIGQKGEMYIRGPFVAQGYYNSPDKTKAVFVQNPLNPFYPEVVYKTGDIVWTNERGELMYAGRKDFQIKHLGFRIELGEIESATSAIDGVSGQACIYDAQSDVIVLFYTGPADKGTVRAALKKRIPDYMMPQYMIQMSAFPHNSNEKIDRMWLKNNYKSLL